MQRDVEIEWIKPLAKGLWQVQFRTLDYLPEYDYPVINIWRATMRISYVKIPFIKREDGILNPYGFLVNNFSLAYHGTPEPRRIIWKPPRKLPKSFINSSFQKNAPKRRVFPISQTAAGLLILR